jgi:hypothetical protein
MTTRTFCRELRELLPVWLVSVLLPVPAILFWHSVHGRSIALGCFFIGCATFVAFSFRRDVLWLENSAASDQLADRGRDWRERMKVLMPALLAAFAVFSILCLAFNNPPASEEQAIWWHSSLFKAPRDLIATMLAFMTLIPSLGLVPYLILATRSRFAAVVFSILLVFCMKLLGATVLVCVYGWNAAEQGRTTMPWNHPDLLVWLFWGFTLVLSLSFYLLGARRFQRMVNHG